MSTDVTVQVSSVGPRLTGKTSIITGAGSGMGYAAVERFLAEGGDVVAIDLREEGLEKLRAAHGEEHLMTSTCDVTDQQAVSDVVGAAVDRFGAVDVYFNNAGVPFVAKPIEEVTDEDWDVNMAVNLKAILDRRPRRRARHEGAGRRKLHHHRVHGRRAPASQPEPLHGRQGRSGALRKGDGHRARAGPIRVNAICPVAADTPMLAQFGAGDHITAKATPMGRLAEAEEVAAVALFLASDDAAFITGLAIPVDGGRSI